MSRGCPSTSFLHCCWISTDSPLGGIKARLGLARNNQLLHMHMHSRHCSTAQGPDNRQFTGPWFGTKRMTTFMAASSLLSVSYALAGGGGGGRVRQGRFPSFHKPRFLSPRWGPGSRQFIYPWSGTLATTLPGPYSNCWNYNLVDLFHSTLHCYIFHPHFLAIPLISV